MRILHVSRTMGQGGAEKVIYQLCLDNDRDDQVVLSNGGNYVQQLEKNGIKHYLMPDLDSKNPINMTMCFLRILRIAQKEKVDIIHTHHRMAAFYAKIIVQLTRRKTIYTAHNVFYNRKALTKFALSRVKIVAVGDGVKKNLVDFFEIKEEYIITIYNSVRTEVKGYGSDEIQKHKKDGNILIGTIGRITEQKGIDVFIKAFANVIKRNPNVVGVVVGDGELRSDMESLAKKLKLDNKILFLGYRDNVLDIINQLNFVVLASRWEGLPLTPIETFSQGKTIIASDITGNNEVITNDITGLLFEKDNVISLTECMEKLISDKSLLNFLQENANNCYNAKYLYHNFIEKYKEAYATV